jgi:hypothetical protein
MKDLAISRDASSTNEVYTTQKTSQPGRAQGRDECLGKRGRWSPQSMTPLRTHLWIGCKMKTEKWFASKPGNEAQGIFQRKSSLGLVEKIAVDNWNR